MASMTQTQSNAPCSPCSTSSSPSSSCKSVQFSRFVKISFTYDGEEYDRSALEPSKLSTTEESELLQMRSHWRQEMSKRQDAPHHEEGQLVDVPESSVSPSSSTCSSPQKEPRPYHGRTHPHLLLQPASSSCCHSSPPCSPVLSHQDSCSSSSSDDEYGPTLSPKHPLSLTPQQQQQYQRLKRFGGSRNGMNGMMHRHSHLDQSKENVQCIA